MSKITIKCTLKLDNVIIKLTASTERYDLSWWLSTLSKEYGQPKYFKFFELGFRCPWNFVKNKQNVANIMAG